MIDLEDIQCEQSCYEYSVHFNHYNDDKDDGDYIEVSLSMCQLLSIIDDKNNTIISIENHPIGSGEKLMKEK